MSGVIIDDLLLILTAGLIAGLICRRIQLSVLVGYLLVGACLGEGGLRWIQDEHHQLEYLAEAGVFLLLFAIGLEFSLDELLKLGTNLLIGGGVQMLLVAVPVTGFLFSMGMGWSSALIMGPAVAFSSTVLVFKALSERGEVSKPHGRRAIGILLFQDMALIPLLLMVPLLTGEGKQPGLSDYLQLALTSLCFVLGIVGVRKLLGEFVIPGLARFRSPDLVVLFTLVSLGGLALIAYLLGLPPAIGAFAAGLVFNGNRWSKQIDALVLPFRETFSAIFFTSLGLFFDPRFLIDEPITTAAMLAGLIILKASAATIALKLTGLNWQKSAGKGIGLAHIGEFAFVLTLLGREAGVVTVSDYRRLVTLAICSLIVTPMLLSLGLRWSNDSSSSVDAEHEEEVILDTQRRAIVVGAGPIGKQVTSRLETMGHDVCLVYLSSINLYPFAQLGFRTVAGDAAQAEILELALVRTTGLIVVCVPSDEMSIQIVQMVRKLNSNCFVLVRCRYQGTVPKLKKVGAERVVSEEMLASLALLDALEKASSQQLAPPSDDPLS
ncbi:Inner membrane protein YbaL [Thalassoglobus neptunius]|uniref:Inner membrane protein YbaL n=1 Tax=Thalassoglobus neptunius TaxID=1938619 RepID=A0A5C5WXU4_9PLAN|nr:cation:proton antiporter [Thalassoglobus neptunius]TWT55390.1 Inner membrane protein YbaL [Thalassoglobus neptunius]